MRIARITPRTAVILAIAAYLLCVPVLHRAGNGYFTIMSLVPVITVGLLHGSRRGLQAAAFFTPLNVALVVLIEGSAESMTAAGGIMGTFSLFGVGWLVGYLHDLSNGRLLQVVEEKDRLIGTISHELRTPLSTVVGLSHELAERVADFTKEEIAEFCGLIAQQSSELEALIEDLLVAARADIERIKVLRVPVDLMGAVEGAVALSTDGWATDAVRVHQNGDAAVALADGLRVRQIVRNLLQNAQRYGGDNVDVVVHQGDGRCVVTVSDDGDGISDDRSASIFDPHVRAHSANGNADSLGLGLYVSRTLARLMDGELNYRREGDRTCFDLILPSISEAIEAEGLSA